MEFTGERFVPERCDAQISYEHWHRYLLAAEFVDGKRVLDIACGEGYGSTLLARTASEVVGVDIDPQTISFNKRKYAQSSVQFIAAPATPLPVSWSGTFDVVVSLETIEHLSHEDQVAFLSEVARVLKPDGVFVASTPDKMTYSDIPSYANPFHVRELYVQQFRDLVAQHFSYTALLGQRTVVASYMRCLTGRMADVLEYRLTHTEGGYRPTEDPLQPTYSLVIAARQEVAVPASSILVDLSDGLWKDKEQAVLRHIQERDARINDLVMQVRDLQSAHDQASLETKLAYERTIFTLEEQVRTQASIEQDLRAHVSSWEQRTEAERQRVQDHQSFGQILADRFDRALAAIDERDQRILVLSGQCERLQQEGQSTAEALAYLQSRLDVQDSLLADRDHVIRMLQGTVETLQSQNSMLQGTVDTLHRSSDTGETQTQLRASQGHIRALEEIVDELRQQIQSQEATLASLRDALTLWETHWQQLQRTRTWKVVMLGRRLRHPFHPGRAKLDGPTVLSESQSRPLSPSAPRRTRLALRRWQRWITRSPLLLHLDEPDKSQGLPSSFLVRGWAYSARSRVIHVEVRIDGSPAGVLTSGVVRSDVAAALQDEGALHSGFSGMIDCASLPLGPHVLDIVARDDAGRSRSVRSQIVLTGEAVPLPGAPDGSRQFTGMDGAGEVLYHLDMAEVKGRRVTVQGWATWYSVNAHREIRVNLGNRELARSRIYLSRPELRAALPGRPDAVRSGFMCTFDWPPTEPLQRAKEIAIEFLDEEGVRFVVHPDVHIGQPDKSSSACVSADLITQAIDDAGLRLGRSPVVLDWDSYLDIRERRADLVVFSPPTRTDALPYLDKTVDVVITTTSIPEQREEARRVARTLVVTVSGENFPAPCLEWLPTEDISSSVSIVIPVHNRWDVTSDCLSTLLSHLPPIPHVEIIVVDDASTDVTPERLTALSSSEPRLRTIRNPTSLGFLESVNRGADEARNHILVFLNNDTLSRKDWLTPLVRTFATRPDAGAVGGKLLYPDGILQEAGGVIYRDGTGCNFGKYDQEPGAPIFNHVREVDYCSGALLATPRDLFLQLGKFDRQFAPAYYEDADYCFTLRVHGFKVYYQPEAEIVHLEGASSGRDVAVGAKRHQVINHQKFLAKWGKTLASHPSPPTEYTTTTWHALAERPQWEDYAEVP